MSRGRGTTSAHPLACGLGGAPHVPAASILVLTLLFLGRPSAILGPIPDRIVNTVNRHSNWACTHVRPKGLEIFPPRVHIDISIGVVIAVTNTRFHRVPRSVRRGSFHPMFVGSRILAQEERSTKQHLSSVFLCPLHSFRPRHQAFGWTRFCGLLCTRRSCMTAKTQPI